MLNLTRSPAPTHTGIISPSTTVNKQPPVIDPDAIQSAEGQQAPADDPTTLDNSDSGSGSAPQSDPDDVVAPDPDKSLTTSMQRSADGQTKAGILGKQKGKFALSLPPDKSAGSASSSGSSYSSYSSSSSSSGSSFSSSSFAIPVPQDDPFTALFTSSGGATGSSGSSHSTSVSEDPFVVVPKKERKKDNFSFALPLRSFTSNFGSRVRTNIKTPDAEEVQAILKKLEKENISAYNSEFTHDHPELSVTKALGEIFPGKEISRRDVGRGAFGAEIVTVESEGGTTETDPARQFILKKATPPTNLWDMEHFEEVERRLKATKKEDFDEQVKQVFIERPMGLLNQNLPYYSAVNREMLAHVVGTQVGCAVPGVSSIRCEDGHYSLHEFVESQGTLHEKGTAVSLNVQSMQSVAILDMVLFNTDRTKFNVLAKESRSDGETDMIPIDHAQTLQRDRESTSPEELTLPCWAGRSEANNSLTDASKQAIEKLDVDTIVSAAEARGLVLTEVDRAYIGTNIVSMQSSLAENPEITLKEMADFYFGVDLVTSTKNPFDL